MGTIHSNTHPLHGITVVVDTQGPRVYVGRCEDVNDDRVLLLDADVHEDGTEGRSKQEYVQQAARFGVWAKLDVVAIPQAEVVSVGRLAEVESI
jgi:hypothetical protein